MSSFVDEMLQGVSRQERQAVIDRYSERQNEFQLVDVNLNNVDISGLEFTGITIRSCMFNGAKCRGAIFPGVINCDFSRADLRDSFIPTAQGCQFEECNLDGSRLGNRLTNCDFRRATLRRVTIQRMPRSREGEFIGVRFDHADLAGLDAAGAYLHRASFRFCNLMGARLSRANLEKCDFDGANLEHANLVETSGLDSVAGARSLESSCILREAAASVGRMTSRKLNLFERNHNISKYSIPGNIESEDVSIRWSVVSRLWSIQHDLLISHGIETTGHSFVGETGYPVRLYQMENDGGDVLAVLSQIGADYINWDQCGAFVVNDLRDESVGSCAEELQSLYREIFVPI